MAKHTDTPTVGFAGLASLVSDVVAVLREAEQNVANAAAAARAAKSVEQQRQTAAPRMAASGATAQAEAAGGRAFRWERLVLVAAGIAFVAVLMSNGKPSPRNYEENAPSETSAEIRTGPALPATNSAPAESPPLAVSAPLEERPPAGGPERVLEVPQIRYCLAEEIRIGASKAGVNSYDDAAVDRFNADVDDYNIRCGRYKYRGDDIEIARRDVERERPTLLAAGRRRFDGAAHPKRRKRQPGSS